MALTTALFCWMSGCSDIFVLMNTSKNYKILSVVIVIFIISFAFYNSSINKGVIENVKAALQLESTDTVKILKKSGDFYDGV